eukprot:IDg20335t1
MGVYSTREREVRRELSEPMGRSAIAAVVRSCSQPYSDRGG